ncbi:MAG: hypothetical protein ACI4SS_04830, partial [Clostridia bacterium]
TSKKGLYKTDNLVYNGNKIKEEIIMKKIFILALLTISLAACGRNGGVQLSGNLRTESAKNYSIMLPEECEIVGSELSDLAAQYEGCSVAVVSMPLSQATVCDDKKEFSEVMEGMGYDLSVTDYEKETIGDFEAYRAEYALEKTKITQITYAAEDTAYVVTYARPKDVSKDTDEVFIKGMEAFELSEKD